jgi:NitT/TauT family transport system substrate-binding protein
MSRFVIQPHVRLQEWVAEEFGFFTDEGLDYEFQADGFSARSLVTSSVQTTEEIPIVESGAFEDMSQGRSCDVSSACHWAVNAAAAINHGRMYGHAYSLSPSGIFVAPESRYQRPEDLAGVEVGVGFHSGSHYSAIQALERFRSRADQPALLGHAARSHPAPAGAQAASGERLRRAVLHHGAAGLP